MSTRQLTLILQGDSFPGLGCFPYTHVLMSSRDSPSAHVWASLSVHVSPYWPLAAPDYQLLQHREPAWLYLRTAPLHRGPQLGRSQTHLVHFSSFRDHCSLLLDIHILKFFPCFGYFRQQGKSSSYYTMLIQSGSSL